MQNIEGAQDFINDVLDNLNKEQVLSLLDNPDYRAWIIEELSERRAFRRLKYSIDQGRYRRIEGRGFL